MAVSTGDGRGTESQIRSEPGKRQRELPGRAEKESIGADDCKSANLKIKSAGTAHTRRMVNIV